MADIMITVEALDNNSWKIVEIFSGDEEEILPQAELLKNKWLFQGWPENEIRISKSKFKTFDRKFKDEN